MDQRDLIEARRQAQKAVSDMSDGDLKLKAFEVILNHLLESSKVGPSERRVQDRSGPTDSNEKRAGRSRQPTSVGERILALRNQGFFKQLRGIGDVREGLGAHGWHYPLTALSGALQQLVRRGELRRQKTSEGKKRVWKYSNP